MNTMARRTYTPAQKAEALALYAEVGGAETARRTGIAVGTLQSWAHRNGVKSTATETTAVAVEAALMSLADRKAKLAGDLMGDIERLRSQLFAPCTERRALTVSVGHGRQQVEIVDIERTQPTFGEQKSIMTTLAIAVDKVQILTGEATERIHHQHSNPIDDELAQLAAELERTPVAE